MTTETKSQISWWLLLAVAMLAATIGGVLNRWSYSDLKATSAAKEAKQWQQVIEDCDTAFIVINDSYEIVKWNRGAQSTFGWSEVEAVGACIELIIPEERYLKGIWDEKYLSQSISKILETDGYMQHKNGKLCHVNIRLMAVVNSRILYTIQVVKVENMQEIQDNSAPLCELSKPHRVDHFRIKK